MGTRNSERGTRNDRPAAPEPSEPGNERRPADAVPQWMRPTVAETVLQGFLAGLCAAAIAVGLVLTPSPTGADTHTQLGLPPCGMLKLTGHPCPTCGVTTSFALAAHGRFVDSFLNQPFGFVCFLVTVGLLAGLGVTLVARRSWQPFFMRVNPLIILGVLLIILLISWAYKWSIT